jgi:hypothetical protein
MNASKAIAAINGRDFVTPDDILEVVPPVLSHRIILSPDKEMEGVTEDAVIKQIFKPWIFHADVRSSFIRYWDRTTFYVNRVVFMRVIPLRHCSYSAFLFHNCSR